MQQVRFTIILILLCSMSLAADKIADLPEVMQPQAISTDGRVLYVMEEDGIRLYRLDPFQYIQTIGRRGEGPGEFNSLPFVTIESDNLMVQTLGKLMTFSKKGEFIQQTKLPFVYFYWFAPLMRVGNHYVGFPVSRKENSTDFFQVARLYNQDMKPIKDFYDGVYPLMPLPARRDGKKTEVDWPLIPDCVYLQTYGDRIYVGDTRKGFHFTVFDTDGKHLYDINRTNPRLKIPKKFKDATMAEFKETTLWEMNKDHWNFIMRDDFPAFTAFWVKDGKIFLTSYEQKDGKYKMTVLDLKGGIINESYVVPFEPATRRLLPWGLHDLTATAAGGIFYYLRYDEEAAVYSLHRFHIGG